MKVAVLLCGNMRTCQETQLRLPPNADVYVATYNLQYNMHPVWKQNTKFYEDFVLNTDDVKNMLLPLVPREIRVLPIDNWSDARQYKVASKYPDIYSQYCTVRLCDSLRAQSGEQYDVVIKTRPDITPLDWTDCLKHGTVANTLHIALGDFPDLVFAGSPSVLERVCEGVLANMRSSGLNGDWTIHRALADVCQYEGIKVVSDLGWVHVVRPRGPVGKMLVAVLVVGDANLFNEEKIACVVAKEDEHVSLFACTNNGLISAPQALKCVATFSSLLCKSTREAEQLAFALCNLHEKQIQRTYDIVVVVNTSAGHMAPIKYRELSLENVIFSECMSWRVGHRKDMARELSSF